MAYQMIGISVQDIEFRIDASKSSTIENAKKFFKQNAAPAEDLTLQKEALAGQLNDLDPTSDDYKALEAKIAQLESTINKYDTLIPDINVLDDPNLLTADGSLDVGKLLSTTQTKTAEIIKINSFLILGISILTILINGEILSKRHCLDSYK